MSKFRLMKTSAIGDVLLTLVIYDDMSSIRVSFFLNDDNGDTLIESHIVIREDNHEEIVTKRFNEIDTDELETLVSSLIESIEQATEEELEEGAFSVETEFYDNEETPRSKVVH